MSQSGYVSGPKTQLQYQIKNLLSQGKQYDALQVITDKYYQDSKFQYTINKVIEIYPNGKAENLPGWFSRVECITTSTEPRHKLYAPVAKLLAFHTYIGRLHQINSILESDIRVSRELNSLMYEQRGDTRNIVKDTLYFVDDMYNYYATNSVDREYILSLDKF